MNKRKFLKSIAGISLCAILALGYVHQEVEIVKTGFLINKHRSEVSFQLDQYRSLVYNLSRLESPKRVEAILCMNDIALCMPKVKNKRRFSQIARTYDEEKPRMKKSESLLAYVLDRFSTNAEAKVAE
ncbi:MAG: hypothetical protein NG740_01105 [Omnitrophica bacterium]|nr:hypothetical protein [Candidatus Omnitrophota bacterium]